MSHEERIRLEDGDYRVYVDSELKEGSLTYGEIIIPGETSDEIFFSSYICHPSMANNELSGPCIAAHLARWIASAPRRFTYRIIFIPETIGSITYLSRNLDDMKKNIAAGFNLSCLGDPGHFSYIASRYGDTLADRAATAILGAVDPGYRRYSFLERGSDERQYNAPGVDLPVCCLTRTKFGEYEEYHTSADNMDYITAGALGESFEMCCKLVESLEANKKYKIQCLCEPQLSQRGLYPTISDKNSGGMMRTMMNFLAYCDGRNDLFEISEIIGVPVLELLPLVSKLSGSKIIDSIKEAECTP
jgi:aminopeptidase-like protein